MKQLMLFSVLVLLLVACGKDKFETKPHLKIKDVNTKNVAQGQTLSVTMQFTDKEGDVSDSIYIVRQRLNVHGPMSNVLPFKIPDFPNTQKGDIVVNLDYFNTLTLQIQEIRIPGSNPSRNEPDTMSLKFVAKDKGGNFSDTAVLADVFVER